MNNIGPQRQVAQNRKDSHTTGTETTGGTTVSSLNSSPKGLNASKVSKGQNTGQTTAPGTFEYQQTPQNPIQAMQMMQDN